MNSYRNRRIVLFDTNENNIRNFKEVVRRLQISDLKVSADFAFSFETIKFLLDADVVFVHWPQDDRQPLHFCRAMRYHERSPNPFLPIVVMSEAATEHNVELARDAGVDEFLVCPFSAKSLEERLRSVFGQRRGFIRTESYFGPDRRRGAMAKMLGQERRSKPTEMIDPATGETYVG